MIKQHRHVIQGGFCWPHGSSRSLSPESLGKLGFLRRSHLQSMFLVTPRMDPGILLPVRKSSAQVSGGSCSLWQNQGWDSGFRPLANMAQGMARAGSLCSEAVSPGACQREEPQPMRVTSPKASLRRRKRAFYTFVIFTLFKLIQSFLQMGCYIKPNIKQKSCRDGGF